MIENGLVSVIIPCYNAEKFIKETIQSVLNQSYSQFELIIVNDGSKDNSEKEILTFDDPRIQYISKENGGVSKARNIGIEKAKGEFLAFLDADDIFEKDNLKKKIEFLKTNKDIGLVHSLEQKFDHETRKNLVVTEGKEGNVLNLLLEMSCTVIHSPASILMRNSLLQKIGGFDENLSTSADWEFWVRVASKTEIGLIKEPLIKYRIHPDQMHLNVERMESDMHYAFNKSKNSNVFMDEKHYKYCYSKLCLILSASYIGDSKQYFKGLKFLIKSLTTNPVHLKKRFFK
ncbi:MAG: glycosyltransferase [Cytophagales bacterium]|nr:glycosyltransferase [Cytophagales bacterium]